MEMGSLFDQSQWSLTRAESVLLLIDHDRAHCDRIETRCNVQYSPVGTVWQSPGESEQLRVSDAMSAAFPGYLHRSETRV